MFTVTECDDDDDVMDDVGGRSRDRCYNYESELDIDQINVSDSEANLNSHLMTSAAPQHVLPLGMTDSQLSGSLVGDTDFDPGSDPENAGLYDDDVVTSSRDDVFFAEQQQLLRGRRAAEYSDDENET